MNILKFLKENVKPARGCTEPIAVGLAASLAYMAIHEQIPTSLGGTSTYQIPPPEKHRISKVTIQTDRDVYKNSYAVCIPKTGGQRGMGIAAAMGLYCNPEKGLNLLEGINPVVVRDANELLKQEKIKILDVEDTGEKSELDINVGLEYLTNEGIKKSSVRIQREHSNVTNIVVNGKILYKGEVKDYKRKEEELPEELSDLVEIARNLTPEEREEVYKGVVMNKAIIEEGLAHPYALNVAGYLQHLVEKGLLEKDLVTDVRIQAAAAADARMGGADFPVMSSAGSGNQGITASVPIIVTDEYMGPNKDKLSEGLMLSHLVTKFVTNYSGYLSALCGCNIKAGVGAAAPTISPVTAK